MSSKELGQGGATCISETVDVTKTDRYPGGNCRLCTMLKPVTQASAQTMPSSLVNSTTVPKNTNLSYKRLLIILP
jgi:hypothetical protein